MSLPTTPPEAESIADCDKRASSAGVAHRRVTFIGVIMQAGTLKETKSDAAHRIFFYSTIRLEFDAQDQLGWDGLDTSRDLAHLVHLLFAERVELFVDCCAPLPPLRRG